MILDYLNKRNLNLNSPSFDLLRDFVIHELNTMTFNYAQAFFKSNKKMGPASPRVGLRI